MIQFTPRTKPVKPAKPYAAACPSCLPAGRRQLCAELPSIALG
jgi:hypothetical protein